VALLAVAAACGGEQGRDRVTVRDSAGIRITENSWPVGWDLPACPVDAEPELDIGVVEGAPEYQLYRVFDALGLNDGRIAVVNQGSSEIRFYDRRGLYDGAVGREGDGPGEFRGLTAAWQDGDSLLAWDDELQRFSIFESDGSFVRSFQLSPVLMNAPQVLGPVGHAIHVAYHHLTIEPPGLTPQTLYHIRYDRGGNVIDTLHAYPYGTYGPIGRPEDYMAGRTLFEARTTMVAADDRVYVATGDAPEVHVLDADGRLMEIVRWPDGDRAVRPEQVDRLRQERIARTRNPEARRFALLSIDEVPVSEQFPAVADLRVDDVGSLWVREYPRPGSGPVRAWLVFGRDRALVCRAQVQAGFAITRIQRGLLFGLEEDESDVEHVRAYRFSTDSANGG
jgi:hypothetical protein